MNAVSCVETLVASGDIPADAQVVSTNNKIVVISSSEDLVARISHVSEPNDRDDPHDLSYSHQAAWLAGSHGAPVVKPLDREPLISSGYMISRYPRLTAGVTLDTTRAYQLTGLLKDFSEALPHLQAGMALRHLNVAKYVRERLDYVFANSTVQAEPLATYVDQVTEGIEQRYPFIQLVEADTALTHGDLKSDNVVVDGADELRTIDLDAVSVGPSQYDAASWRLRCALGDTAAIEEVVQSRRQEASWNEETYRALIGWKALSSMSFTLRYESADLAWQKIADLSYHALALGGLESTPLQPTR